MRGCFFFFGKEKTHGCASEGARRIVKRVCLNGFAKSGVGCGRDAGTAQATSTCRRNVLVVVGFAFNTDHVCSGLLLKQAPKRKTNTGRCNARRRIRRHLVDVAHDLAVYQNRRAGFLIDRFVTAFAGDGTWHDFPTA